MNNKKHFAYLQNDHQIVNINSYFYKNIDKNVTK